MYDRASPLSSASRSCDQPRALRSAIRRFPNRTRGSYCIDISIRKISKRTDIVVTRAEGDEHLHVRIIGVVHDGADGLLRLFARDDQVERQIDNAVFDIRIAMKRGDRACEEGLGLAAAIATGGDIADTGQIPEAAQMKIKILAGFDRLVHDDSPERKRGIAIARVGEWQFPRRVGKEASGRKTCGGPDDGTKRNRKRCRTGDGTAKDAGLVPAATSVRNHRRLHGKIKIAFQM